MLKNIIIISTILLLFSTLSLIKPRDAKSSSNILTDIEKADFSVNESNKISPRLNEIHAVGALRQLYDAQKIYRDTVGNGQYGTLFNLYEAGLIDARLRTGVKFGYTFATAAFAPSEFSPATFKLYASPIIYRKTGRKSFYFDHRCNLRGADKQGGLATENDLLISVCEETDEFPLQNEQQIISIMRNLASAQETYRSTQGNGNYGTLQELYDAGLIKEDITDGIYSYYFFTAETQNQTKTNPSTFRIRSKPTMYGETGFKSFYIDQTAVLRGADKQGEDADANDPPIKK